MVDVGETRPRGMRPLRVISRLTSSCRTLPRLRAERRCTDLSSGSVNKGTRENVELVHVNFLCPNPVDTDWGRGKGGKLGCTGCGSCIREVHGNIKFTAKR
jgi:hypothetical protein